jgi:hypothetical protein
MLLMVWELIEARGRGGGGRQWCQQSCNTCEKEVKLSLCKSQLWELSKQVQHYMYHKFHFTYFTKFAFNFLSLVHLGAFFFLFQILY